MRVALFAIAAIISGTGASLAQPASNGSTSSYSSLAWITDRAPTKMDTVSRGFPVGSKWQYDGVVWEHVSNGVWVPQAAAQFPVYAAPTAYSFNGTGAGNQQRIVDVLGSIAKVACGTTALKAGYTGKAITVTTTVSASPVTTDIDILSTGLLDVATLNATLAAADAGTSAYVTKCWDQTGNGNHLTKHASYSGPIIGARAWNGIPQMSWGYELGNAGLVIPNTFTAAGNNFSAFLLGEMLNATGAGTAVWETGDSSVSGPSLSIISPFSGASTMTGLNLFSRSMGTPSPQYPAVFAPTTGQILGLTSSAGTATLFSNEQSATISWNSSATMVGGNLGRSASGTYRGMMAAFGFVLTNAAPTADQVTRIKSSAYALYGFTPQIADQVFTIGDSRTQGYLTNVGNSWPTQMAPMLNAVRPVKVVNFGVGGQTALKISTDAAVVLPAYKAAGARNIAVIGPIGTNDMYGGASAATVFGYMQTICAAFTAAGFTTVAVNELPRNDATQTAITAYRALFNAGPTGCTYSIDPAANVSQLSNATNTTYYPDGLHLSDAANGLLAAYIARTVAPRLQ